MKDPNSLLEYYKFRRKFSVYIPIFAGILFFIGIVKVYETWWLGLVFMCWGLFVALIYILAIIYVNKKIKKLEEFVKNKQSRQISYDITQFIDEEGTAGNQQSNCVPVATMTESHTNTQSTQQVVGGVNVNAKEQVQNETIIDEELGINVSQLDEHMKKVYDLYKKGYITKEQFEKELKNK